MNRKASSVSATEERRKRLSKPSDVLRAMLIDAVCVVTGGGPRGKDNSVWEARNKLAPKLYGVVSENVDFLGRHSIVATAAGPMMFGFRKLDLLRVCAEASTPERPVILWELDIVQRLALMRTAGIVGPQYQSLSHELRCAAAPLYGERFGPIPPYHVDFENRVFGAWRF